MSSIKQIIQNQITMEQKLRQAQKECYKWEQKYNTLLQKNQNDLIKIRIRQKQLNETIGKLQKQKEEIKQKLEARIRLLQKQIDQSKALNKNEKPNEKDQSTNLTNNGKNKDLDLKQKHKEEQKINETQNCKSKELKKELNDLQEKKRQLEEQLEETKKQNVQIKKQFKENLKRSQSQTKQEDQKQKIHDMQIQNKIIDFQRKVSDLQRDNLQKEQRIKQLQKERSEIFEKEIQEIKTNQIQNKQKSKQVQNLYTQIDRLRQLLTLSDTQYKNLLHKQQLKEDVLLFKNDELNQMTQQLIDMQQKVQKYKQFEVYKVKFSQEETRREELEQQNLLLKQMLKGHKTMIKIKDNQIERLKSKVPEQSSQKK